MTQYFPGGTVPKKSRDGRGKEAFCPEDTGAAPRA
jgi:hypothetical protein